MPHHIQTHPAFVSYNWTVDDVVNAARLIPFLSFTILQEQGVPKITAHEKTLLNFQRSLFTKVAVNRDACADLKIQRIERKPRVIALISFVA